MLNLKSLISPSTSVNLDDMLQVKSGLGALGYELDEMFTPYPSKASFNTIRKFQSDEGLEVDGIMKPNGPTVMAMNNRLKKSASALGAFGDFAKNYLHMRLADTKKADKYFHCKANYEAASRGRDSEQTAISLSDARETYGQVVKHDPFDDMVDDQKANINGRQRARSGLFSSAEEACAIYRPEGLDEKY